jgi:hypothetical protein
MNGSLRFQVSEELIDPDYLLIVTDALSVAFTGSNPLRWKRTVALGVCSSKSVNSTAKTVLLLFVFTLKRNEKK